MSDLYGCSDHGCIYGHRGGMGTNGGCQCEKELQRSGHQKAARQLRLLRQRIAKLEATNAVLVEALENVIPCLPQIPGRCSGYKCREPYCMSCFGEDAAWDYFEGPLESVRRSAAEALAKAKEEEG